MDQRIKRTLFLVIAVLVVFPVAVMLTGHFTPVGKGVLHATISLVFLALLFNIWSSLKPFTGKKVLLTVIWAIIFYFGLPIAIDLVAFLPIILKGLGHFVVIALFVAAFLWIWYDESKAPEHRY